MSIAALHSALQNGTLTCEGLVVFCLDRISVYDERLNAVIAVNPNALAESQALDARRNKGEPLAPLHGVPVILKDNIETADMATTAGSKSLAGWHSGRDAFMVQKLRQAGAIILAKANLHEFAIWGESVSSILGQTRNPYDYTRTPGGSSGGTGAAIAAGFGLVGVGTDTVNSIRSPSSACCLCGIRPTVGLISRHGVVPYSLTQDTAGPMARTVEDAARLLTVMAGWDEADEATAAMRGRPPLDYTDFLNSGGLRGKRLGVLSSLFGSRKDSYHVNAVVGAALNRMKAAGAQLIHLDRDISAERLTRDVSVHLHELAPHLNGYLAGFGKAVPVHSVQEVLQSGRYTPDIESNLQKALLLAADAKGYAMRLEKRARLQSSITALMAEHRLNALVYPHQKQLVCKIGQSQARRNGVLAAVTGFPAITVPGGFSLPDENAPLGVPVGIEFMGRPFEEGDLLEIAYGFEQTAPAHLAPVLQSRYNEQ